MFGNLLATALRTLSRPQHRGYAVAVVLTLALGIGAVTAIWSMVHAVLLAPLPFRAPDQIVRLAERNDTRGLPDFAVSVPNFESWREADTGFVAMAGLREQSANLSGDIAPERVPAMLASGNLWSLLGLPLLSGRPFDAAEERSGAVAIISEGLWRRRYAADPGILGRRLRVDGVEREIVAVAPQDVGFSATIDLWLPLQPFPGAEDRGDRRLAVVARLAPDTTLAQARERIDRHAETLERQFPESNQGWRVQAFPAQEWIVGTAFRERLQLLLAAVVLILLVACSNVSNLQLARAATRVRELGVRQALGASRARLVGEMGAESLVLVLVGGALGLALAYGALQIMIGVLPGTTPRLAGLALRPVVAGAALGACAVVAFLFGLLPALLAARGDATVALQRGRGGTDTRRATLRRVLVVAQFALTTLLAVGAAQMLQQWLHLQRMPLGFDPTRVLTARISLPEASDEGTLARQQQAYSGLIESLGALPGVAAAGLANEIPQGDIDTQMHIQLASEDAASGGANASWRIVSPSYLQAMRIPLLAGRGFAERDESGESVLLGEGLARSLWPQPADGIGRWVRLGNGLHKQVVGIVGDVRQRGVADAPTPTMYFPTSWWLWPTMSLVVRAESDPAALAPAVRGAAARAFPDQPLYDVRPLSESVGANIATPRLQAALVLGFAGAGLLLAALGIAGVVAYLVAQRTQELAVRMALGASPRRVLRRVMAGGTALCATGVALGLLLAAGVSRVLQSVVRDAGASVSVSVLASVAVLVAVGLVATWLPARRVLRISPSAALRGD
jgi:predicted permease